MDSDLSTQSVSALKIRSGKVRLLQAARLARWLTRPAEFAIAPRATSEGLELQHRVQLRAEGVQSHPRLERGKLSNLRVAAAHFDGRLLRAETPFSFWRILGRPIRSRGFAPGTELRDGCVVPTFGGGLCLLSGALFRLAAEMDWTIIERHGHTIAGQDRQQVDATVMWPQVDLRFAPKQGVSVLRVRLQAGLLTVEAYGRQRQSPLQVWREFTSEQAEQEQSELWRRDAKGRAELLGRDHKRASVTGLARNCLTCERRGCRARPRLLRVLR